MKFLAVPGSWPDQAMRICLELGRGKIIHGRRYNCSRWTIPTPEGYAWAVYAKRGAAVVALAHDSFEIARVWHQLDSDLTRPAPMDPILVPSDAELAERNSAQRRHPDMFAHLDMWLDHIRGPKPAREQRPPMSLSLIRPLAVDISGSITVKS